MNQRLVSRLAVPIALLSGLMLLTAIASAWHLRSLQHSVAGLITNHVDSVRAAQELEISIREVRTQLDRYLITADRRHLESVPRLRKRTAAALEAAELASTTSTEEALMRRTRAGYDHFFVEYDKLVARPPAQGLYLTIIELIDNVLTREILAPAHEYLRLNEGGLAQVTTTNAEMTEKLTIGLVALGVCGAAGGLLGGWLIAGTIRRSMLQAEQRLWDAALQLDQVAHPGTPSEVRHDPSRDALEQVASSVSVLVQRLRQTEKNALRAEQLARVGQMAAGIAHEIRNPLMTIKLLVQAASERQGGSLFPPRELHILEEEIVRLEQIVAGFLDFARAPQPKKRPTDLRTLVSQVVESVRVRGDLQGVRIDFNPPANRPVDLPADPNLLRQVLFNLMINALEAQPGGGWVRVRIDDDPTSAVLTVEDGGTGLPEDLGDRIFEPFVSTKESGLGLGLSICRRIVEAHGGTLQAVDGPHGGASFTLRLRRDPTASVLIRAGRSATR